MSEQTLPEGTIIAGKYRVVRQLGGGGMGVVVEAVHVTLGQRVALKLMRDSAAATPGATERFLREARIAAQLTSEHVARVTDMGHTETGAPFLVMELLVGRDLDAELAARGALPIAEAVDYVLQACEGLAEVHAAGLVHRDIKPANLFLARRRKSSAPVVKVLDFGLSKSYAGDARLTQSAATFGTPQYMSPEQTRSTKHVDARSDQHAIGLVLYELVTGAPAYDGATPMAVLIDIAVKAAPRAVDARPDVPRALDAAIARSLAKQPEDRFPDLAGLARAIAPFGGPGAAASVRAIEDCLGPPSRAGAQGVVAAQTAHGAGLIGESSTAVLVRQGPGAGPGSPGPPSSDDQISTAVYRRDDPAAHGAPGVHGGLTTDSDPNTRSTRRRTWVLVACAAAMALGAAAGWALLRDDGGGRARPSPAATASATATASAMGSPSTASARNPEPPVVTPAPSAAEATAAPSASARPVVKPAPSPRKVFGGG